MNNSLADLIIKGLFDITAGKGPVSEGGSISVLSDSIAAAPTEMVADLVAGKKKYIEIEEQMKELVECVQEVRRQLALDIDHDSEACSVVFAAFQMPKETDRGEAACSTQIQEATEITTNVPMKVARRVCSLLSDIEEVISSSNQSAVADNRTTIISARNAIIGVLFSVHINLTPIKDEQFVANMATKADCLERKVIGREAEVVEYIREACK